jgi:hypothetical protein
MAPLLTFCGVEVVSEIAIPSLLFYLLTIVHLTWTMEPTTVAADMTF